MFDAGKGGKAEPGPRYKSRQHKIDSLQATHTNCNKRTGNLSEVAKSRHPAMPPLTVADAIDAKGLRDALRLAGEANALAIGPHALVDAASRCHAPEAHPKCRIGHLIGLRPLSVDSESHTRSLPSRRQTR